MFKFIKGLLGLIVALIALVLIAGLFISKDFHAEQSVEINTPKETVWNQVNTLKGLNEWSPWPRRDANIQQTINGIDGTVGASMDWKGNKEVGQGSQTITAVIPGERLDTKLKIIKPWAGEADVYVQLKGTGGAQTTVTWAFNSKSAYPMNVMSFFIKGTIEKDYKDGLNNLKQLCDSPVK